MQLFFDAHQIAHRQGRVKAARARVTKSHRYNPSVLVSYASADDMPVLSQASTRLSVQIQEAPIQ